MMAEVFLTLTMAQLLLALMMEFGGTTIPALLYCDPFAPSLISGQKGLIRPFNDLIRPGLIRPLKGLLRTYKGFIRPGISPMHLVAIGEGYHGRFSYSPGAHRKPLRPPGCPCCHSDCQKSSRRRSSLAPFACMHWLLPSAIISHIKHNYHACVISVMPSNLTGYIMMGGERSPLPHVSMV